MAYRRASAHAAVAPVLVGVAALLALPSAACIHGSEMGSSPGKLPAATIEGTYEPPPPRSEVQVGFATWYGAAFAGRRTASGEPFDPNRLTAAHRTLPFGTWVEVTRVDTGAAVRVRITDRGPFGHADRIIDLSRGAADRLDFVKSGMARVEVRVVDGP
jgi:rare lipoprotein A